MDIRPNRDANGRVVALLVIILLLLTPHTPETATVSTTRVAAPPFVRSPARVSDVLAPAAAPQVAPPPLTTTVNVNVLFIGFDQSQLPADGTPDPFAVNPFWFDILLPPSADPVVASWLDFGLLAPAGYHVDFRYARQFAPASLEQRFFALLTQIGEPAPRTSWQTRYNNQVHNAVDIPDQILRIDGATVEQWLSKETKTIPGFTDSGYTLVFVNWWGHPGFQFHVYTGTGVDPDTGRNLADLDAATMAWGGTYGKLWFYDASAGPDAETSNWNVDDNFVTGAYHPDEVNRLIYGPLPDYRFPPFWEMNNFPDTQNDFIRDEDIGFNLAVIARTAILGRVAAVPLYDPVATAPVRSGRKLLKIVIVDGNPSYDATRFLSTDWLEKRLEELQPMYQWDVSVSIRPLDAEAWSAFTLWTHYWDFLNWPPAGQDCLGGFGYYALQCYANAHPEFSGPADASDAVVTFLMFNLSEEVRLATVPIFAPLGIAADDGTPFPGVGVMWNSPAVQERRHKETPGVGLSDIIGHEVGHLAGQMHPFNIWDPDLFGGESSQFTAPWLYVHDQSRTTMGYYSEPSGFGAFDQEVNARNLAASYYGHAFSLLTSTSGPAAAGIGTKLTTAAALFQSGKNLAAARAAREAYESLAQIGQKPAARPSTAQRFGSGDPLRHCALVQTPGCDRGSAKFKSAGAPSVKPEFADLLKKFGFPPN